MTTPASPTAGPAETLLVADIGNSQIKLAVVAERGRGAPGATGLPTVALRRDLDSRGFPAAHVDQWLGQAAPTAAVMLVASVYDAAAARLEATLAELCATKRRPVRPVRIGLADLPLDVAVQEPRRVGIDRLAAAAAARLVKRPGSPAVVVDCGTAVTVDLVSPAGAFLGGAILPGPGLMARALAEGTSRLPAVAALERGVAPPFPGRSTEEAIAAGIGWGIRGAVARLVAEARAAGGGDADVILTGGWRTAVRDVLPGAIEVPDLVLAGVALAAERACAR